MKLEYLNSINIRTIGQEEMLLEAVREHIDALCSSINCDEGNLVDLTVESLQC